jgi:hypothetical protein
MKMTLEDRCSDFGRLGPVTGIGAFGENACWVGRLLEDGERRDKPAWRRR